MIARLSTHQLAGVAVLVLFLTGCAVTGGWQPGREGEDVRVDFREYPGSVIPEFRAVVTIDASRSSVVSVMTDFDAWPEWVYGCRHAKILQTIGYTEAYVYQVTGLPIVRDRDMLMHAEMTTADDEVIIEVESVPDYCENNERSSCRVPNESDLVRVTQLSATFRIKRLDNDQVKVIWQQHFDPGGSIPSWATRLMLLKVPTWSLRRLKQLAEGDSRL